ncbi:hypothetical protein C8R44DRAFT_732685 [Mycena epipterygia]|nr:hypothetical protein C8R44DRAFT_732685 [Mycena epipterygia]
MSKQDITLAFLLQASDTDVEAYKRYINLPAEASVLPHFSASNRLKWVNLDNEQQPAKRRADEVIDISDDDSDSSAPLPPPIPPKKRVKHVIVKTEPTGDPLPSASIAPSTPAFFIIVKHNKADRVIITQKENVARIVSLDHIPPRLPPDADTAYIITLTGANMIKGRKETFTGRPKGLDALLKAEDQDLWGQGSNGSTVRDTKLTIFNDLPSRRSIHQCNGALCCEFFDNDLLLGYEQTSLDMSLTQEIFARDLEQNKHDSSTSLAVTASFYRSTKTMKCAKISCDGRAVLKRLSDGPSNDGKMKFIGCSKWRATEKFDHRYGAIPAAVDEDVLAHTHFRDDKLVVGNMIPYPCPVTKIVYTSKQPDFQVLVVIFRGSHSHPPWPLEKPGQAAKADVAKRLDAMGTFGATGGKLNNYHPAFRNTRRLRDTVLSGRDASTPAGLLWAGILDQYQHDLTLPPAEQYIHVVRMEGTLKLAVCLEADLAELIHEVR